MVSFPTDERFSPEVAGGSPATFWLPRRGSTSSNTGVGYTVLLLSSFWWSMLFCVWVSGDFAFPRQDYTSASLVFPFCYWHFRVSFVFLWLFCRRLTLWNTSGAAILPYTGVQSDQLSPVERSDSTFSVPLSNRPFITVHLSAFKTRAFIFIFGVSASRRSALWITLQTRERGECRTSRDYYELSMSATLVVMSSVQYYALNSTHDNQRCTHQT